jgi:hypothetical protein
VRLGQRRKLMPNSQMAHLTKDSPASSWDSEISLLTWLATCVSVFSLLFYYQRGDVLLYGDAVAHINIARRVFDSKTPGLLQLGTVWLPLPHLLMIPFLISKQMWQRGVGGSIPSMAAYVFGVIGMFRLVRAAPAEGTAAGSPVRIAAWLAAMAYAANPNLIYMQTTAMGESVYLAFFVWAVFFFAESLRGHGRALTKCGLCLAAACLCRYDGWFVAAAMIVVLLVLAFLPRRTRDGRPAAIGDRKIAVRFVLLAAAAPLFWLAYNGIIYRNPLEFANGPYSAKAIERNSQNAGNPGHPGTGSLRIAAMYFQKSAELNIAGNQWLERLWVALTLAALVVGARDFLQKKAAHKTTYSWVLLFLLLPLPFYSLSIAYGGVPIFVPAWWPFSHYNVRYGLQLLPAFAAALAVVAHFAMCSWQASLKLRFAAVLGAMALIAASYATIWHAGPVSLEEAQVNMRTRNQLERQLAAWLNHLPPDSTLLMYLGDHVGALQQAGIPLRRVINEGNHRVWNQPSDPEGLWERSLANPASYADYIVAFEGDPVWRAVEPMHLRELFELHVTGQARAVVYAAR